MNGVSESYLVGHGAIYDEFLKTSNISLRICAWDMSSTSYFSYFRVSGYPIHVKKHHIDKLKSRTELCRFVYIQERRLDTTFTILKNDWYLLRKGLSYWKMSISWEEIMRVNVVLEEVPNLSTNATSFDENSIPKNLQVHIEAPRRSGMVPRQPNQYVRHIVTNDINTHHLKDSDLLSYDKVLNDSSSKKLQEEMNLEIHPMHKNQVRYLVNPPRGVIPIGCKWIFKKKIGVDEQIDTFTTRLAVKGYCQRQGVDYDKTFSPSA